MTRRWGMAVAAALGCAAQAAACGSGSGGTQGSGDAAAGDVGADAPAPPADGPFACGNSTCQPTQYCVHVCSGSIPVCEPAEDGGACPAGFTPSPKCDGGCSGIPQEPPQCEDMVASSQCPGAMLQGRDAICMCPP